MNKNLGILLVVLLLCAATVFAYDSMYYEQDVMDESDLNENFLDTNEHALDNVNTLTISEDDEEENNNDEQVSTLSSTTANVTFPFQNSAPFVYGGTYMTRALKIFIGNEQLGQVGVFFKAPITYNTKTVRSSIMYLHIASNTFYVVPDGVNSPRVTPGNMPDNYNNVPVNIRFFLMDANKREYLDVFGERTSAGSSLITYALNQKANQQFYINNVDDKHFKMSPVSAPAMCLTPISSWDVFGVYKHIELQPCKDDTKQLFISDGRAILTPDLKFAMTTISNGGKNPTYYVRLQSYTPSNVDYRSRLVILPVGQDNGADYGVPMFTKDLELLMQQQLKNFVPMNHGTVGKSASVLVMVLVALMIMVLLW